jgi:hypothetical protein
LGGRSSYFKIITHHNKKTTSAIEAETAFSLIRGNF